MQPCHSTVIDHSSAHAACSGWHLHACSWVVLGGNESMVHGSTVHGCAVQVHGFETAKPALSSPSVPYSPSPCQPT